MFLTFLSTEIVFSKVCEKSAGARAADGYVAFAYVCVCVGIRYVHVRARVCVCFGFVTDVYQSDMII